MFLPVWRYDCVRLFSLMLILLMGSNFRAFCAFSSSGLSSIQEARQRPIPLLLLSIDGLMPAHLYQAEQLGLKIPHLKSFFKNGVYAQGVQGVVPTLTYPSHVTMLTGVNPSEHGIFNNGLLDPLERHQGAWYWFSSDIKVPTLWGKARESGLVTASLDFPVSVGAEVDHLIVQYWRDSTDLDRKHVRALSTSGLFDELERAYGPYPVGQWHLQSDQKRLEYLLHLWEKKAPDFMTAYFSSVDENAHHHGPFAPETLAAIEGVDVLVGKILDKVDEVIVCLVSDHGFSAVHSQVRINAFLREKGMIEVEDNDDNRGGRKGKVKNWQAYAWEGQGMAAIMLNPQLKEREGAWEVMIEKVQILLEELQEEYPSAIEAILKGEEIRQVGGFPEAAFLVMGRSGYQFSSSLEMPVVGAKPHYQATHGFSPEHPEMDAIFMMKGPTIPKGKSLGRIRMINIAPTLAELLNLRLELAQGHSVLSRLPSLSELQR